MSKKIMDDMVKGFTKRVKEKLPEWLKEKKQETRDILSELEEHIWDKAEELSDTGEPTEDSIRLAIAHMGLPETIAKEYKKRGTPKVYITEELWPSYTGALKIAALVIVSISLIIAIINMIFGDLDFWDNITGIAMGLFFVFGIITIIFVALSMEGYFPEDFKSEKERKKEELEIEKAQEKGLPLSRTGKPLKPMVEVSSEIAGGVFQLIFAVLLVAQPIPALFEIMHTDFRLILVLMGITTFIEGSLDLCRGIIGNYQPTAHQVIHGMTIVVKIMVVPIMVTMFLRPEICPWIYMESWGAPLVNTGISEEFYGLYKLVLGLIVFGCAVAPIENIYKIVKLEEHKIKK